jgi:CheY-like chemotaxis protein
VTYKLLLADNSVTIQRVIELTFSGQDIQVISVGDGDEAIARIPAEKPDVVLADVGMPKKSGYDVAAFVKQHPDLSHIPVLLLAGAFEPVDEVRARQVKSDGVLVKPFEPQVVIARVRELVENSTSRSAAPPGELPAVQAAPPPSAPAVEPPAASSAAATALDVSPEGAPAAPARSVDDYFDRLDAAFATLGNTPAAPSVPVPPSAGDDSAGTSVPTIEDVLGSASLQLGADAGAAGFARVAAPPVEPADANPTLAPAPRPHTDAVSESRQANAIADVFNVLFAIEQGERDPATIRLGPSAPSPEITDDLVDQITRRVLERLAPDSARAVVADIVGELAERLVREEIARLRAHKP